MFTQKQLPQEKTVPPPSDSVRFDAEMQQRIIVLAAKLQNQHQQTVSAAELEAAAAEVGLEPAFVRQAVEQVSATPGSRALSGTQSPMHAWWRRLFSFKRGNGGIPVGALLSALTLSLLFGFGRVTSVLSYPPMVYLYGMYVLAALLGINSENPKKAFWLGAAVLGANMALFPSEVIGYDPASFPLRKYVLYSVSAGGLAGLCSVLRLAGLNWLKPSSNAAEAAC